MTRKQLVAMIPEGWEECTYDTWMKASLENGFRVSNNGHIIYARKIQMVPKSVMFETSVSSADVGGRCIWLDRGTGPNSLTPVKVTLEWEEVQP